jgi:hypothetical protein
MKFSNEGQGFNNLTLPFYFYLLSGECKDANFLEKWVQNKIKHSAIS